MHSNLNYNNTFHKVSYIHFTLKQTYLFANDQAYLHLVIFAMQDKDSDGKISFEEFSQVIGERGSKTDIADLLTVDKAAI